MRRIAFVLFFGFGLVVYPQEKRDLNRIREEIRKLESELETRSKKESSILEQMEDLEREIGLRHRLVFELEKSLDKKQEQASETEKRLQQTTRSHQALRQRVARRMIFLYKKGRFVEWEILISMRGLSQILVWGKYQKKILENDRRNLEQLQKKQTSIQKDSKVLSEELRDLQRLMQEKETESGNLEKTKGEREKMLGQVRRDKTALERQLEQKRQAFRAIQGQISIAEGKRKTSTRPQEGIRFAAMKGKLNWPVTGRIVSKFGRVMDPILKTQEENLGVEIQAQEKAEIVTVASGTVVWVGWQRGMGNMVLIDHGGGYYTVYGHLDVVYVEPETEVKSEIPIGRLGDNKGLVGSKLHFQVWNGKEPFNPEEWLRR